MVVPGITRFCFVLPLSAPFTICLPHCPDRLCYCLSGFSRGLPVTGHRFETVLSSTLVNGRIACAIGFALSIVNWQHFRRSKLQEQTIAKQQNILTRMAYHDSLTDLPNRRFLDELVGEEVERVKNRQRESCLIMCDVDNFKAVNDTYGHLCGDDLLRQFSQLVRESVGSRNTLVRLGGEEFVILVPGSTLAEAAELADLLRETVSGHSFALARTTPFTSLPALGWPPCRERKESATITCRQIRPSTGPRKQGRTV